MAYRLKLSERALREIGEAYEIYEGRVSGLGGDFLEAVSRQVRLIAESPLLFAEIYRGVRRSLVSRFPYSVFYVLRGDLVSILGVIHMSRSQRRWPRWPRDTKTKK